MKRLVVYKAKAKLREIHASLLRHKLVLLQEKQLELANEEEEEGEGTGIVYNASTAWEERNQHTSDGPSDLHNLCLSPELVHDIDDEEEVVDPEADSAALVCPPLPAPISPRDHSTNLSTFKNEQRRRVMERSSKRARERSMNAPEHAMVRT